MRSLFFLVSSQGPFFEDKPLFGGDGEVFALQGRARFHLPSVCFLIFSSLSRQALRDPLSQQHHQHLFPGPCRQGLRGLPREGNFTAGSGGDSQGLRWMGCGGGRCRDTQMCFRAVTTTGMEVLVTFRISKHRRKKICLHPHKYR